MRRSIPTLIVIGGFTALFSILLFFEDIINVLCSHKLISNEIKSAFQELEIRRVISLCILLFLLMGFAVRLKLGAVLAKNQKINVFTVYCREIDLCCYVLTIGVAAYSIYSPSMQALIFLGGAVIGKTARLVLEMGEQWFLLARKQILFLLLISFVSLVTYSSILAPSNPIFTYHGNTRWTGPWDNPNTYGLLLGAGIVTLIGTVLEIWHFRIILQEGGVFKVGVRLFFYALCFVSFALMARGLLHSYSRGAWLATGIGLGYLIWCCFANPGCDEQLSHLSKINRQFLIKIKWLKRNWFPLWLVLASITALSYWHFQNTDSQLMRRIYSTVNSADFSWRNRMAAWEGGLQMIAERPIVGAGWGRPEALYRHYYLLPKLSEGGAIELNDYLLFGSTLGLPALGCFVMYVWLLLVKQPESANQKPKMLGAERLKSVCRAGAGVLLVGFWFDGGLFKWATGAIFWILFELGSVQSMAESEDIK